MPDKRTGVAFARAHILPLNRDVAILQEADVMVAPVVFTMKMVVCAATCPHIEVIQMKRTSPTVGLVGFGPFGYKAIPEFRANGHAAIIVCIGATDAPVAHCEEHRLEKGGHSFKSHSNESTYECEEEFHCNSIRGRTSEFRWPRRFHATFAGPH